jgi:hypothetical protein
MKNSIRVIAFALVCSACGSSGTGSGSATGTVGGQSFSVADAIFLQTDSTAAHQIEITLWSISGVCADLSGTGSSGPTSGTEITLLVESPNAIVAGTYTGSTPSGLAQAEAVSVNGSNYFYAVATNANVTITSVSATSVVGTYAATFASSATQTGGSLSGSFNASFCQTPNQAL